MRREVVKIKGWGRRWTKVPKTNTKREREKKKKADEVICSQWFRIVLTAKIHHFKQAKKEHTRLKRHRENLSLVGFRNIFIRNDKKKNG